MRAGFVVGFGVAAAACSSEDVEVRTATARGRELFDSPAASDSRSNTFACSLCHAATPEARGVLPGSPLGGAIDRPTFWGGARSDLLTAINDCRYYFMGARQAWTPEGDEPRALYAYLASMPKSLPGPQPFTVVGVAADLPQGNRARGEVVYDGACRACHGATPSGEGRLAASIPVLPDEPLRAFDQYGFDAVQKRVVFIEKVRHGPFLGLYGSMPLWSLEAMSDADLSALVTFLNLR